MTCKTDTWENCYDLGWGDLLVPAAYSHPAKMSRSLVFKIVAHALEEKWIQPGQWILDPFGGVGTTALPTLMAGLNYIGVELEPKFVELGRQNIDLWNSRFSGMPKWTGQAQLLQGDSRRLAEVVAGAGVVVGSPPYVGGGHHNDQTGAWGGAVGTGQPTGKDKSIAGYGQGNGQMGQMKEGDIQAVISSPPFAGNSGGRGDASRNGIDPGLFDRHSGGMKGGTGSDPANLDHLPMGTPPMAIVSSPPYAESLRGDNKPDYDRGKIEAAKASGTTAQRSTWGVTNSVGVLTGKGYGSADGNLGNLPPGEISAVIASPPFADSVGSDDPDKRGGLFRDEKRRNDTNLTGTYGETPGQLGGMKAGVAVVGSPPFENSLNNGLSQEDRERYAPLARNGRSVGADYGSTAGQIGATQGDTFWAAARLIVEQCYDILPPNACAIWVVKNYIKAGREVDFTGQWQQLCEACGFETVHVHRAMLVKEHAAQKFMLGGIWMTNKVSRKSFFRRLAEKKGSPPIDFESILCMRKAA